jgi:hypothetical protein
MAQIRSAGRLIETEISDNDTTRSPRRSSLIAVTIAAVYLHSSPTARADRTPTPEERGRIEQALHNLGFVTWKKIELDDGSWEVDDARQSDGKKYDLKLNTDLEVTKQEEDD